MRSRLFLILVSGVMVSLILLVYVVPLIDFSVDNPWWNGYYLLGRRLDTDILDYPLVFLSSYSPRETCLILIPYTPLDNAELTALSSYVSDGGLLILLSDYGYGNLVLEYMDAPVRINESGMLVDPLFKYRSSRLPKIIDFSEDLHIENVSEVYLNHASILMILDERAVVYGMSSSFSYFDLDLDSAYDEGEPQGPFPILAGFRHGEGYVYVMSDPSFLLNSMIDMGDNLNLIKGLAGYRKIILDQYHLKTNIHYRIRESLLKIYGFLASIYILPYLIVALIIPVSYVILRRFHKSEVYING